MSDDIHALSGPYAVNAVDDVERARFERHLAHCPACQAEVDSLVATATLLTMTTQLAPPASLRAKVLADIKTVRPLAPLVAAGGDDGTADTDPTADTETGTSGDGSPKAEPSTPFPLGTSGTGEGNGAPDDLTARPQGDSSNEPVQLHSRRRPRWNGLVAAAAAAVLAIGGFTAWRAIDQPQTVADQILAAGDATRIEEPVAGGGTATVVRSASLKKAVLVASDLPATPDGRVRQLWLKGANGQFVSAGLMPGDGDQVVVLDGDASQALGAGITVEPAGGSTRPTTAPVALFAFA